MSQPSAGALRRLPILLLVLVFLGGVFYWRWVTYHQPLRQVEQRKVDAWRKSVAEIAAGPRRYELEIEPLSDKRLVKARAAKKAIAALRKERRDNSPPLGRGLRIPSPLHTRETTIAEFLRFRLRELDTYRTTTRDSRAAREAGERYLDVYLNQQGRRLLSGIRYDQLLELGNAALAAGSRDPIVRTYHAIVQMETGGDLALCRRTWEEVIAELADSEKPGTVPYYAWTSLWRLARNNDSARADAWRAALPAIINWLKAEQQDPTFRRSVCERLWGLWKELNATERKWLVAGCLLEEGVDPYITHTLAGTYFIERAWQFRGGGWASEVRPEQWEGFEKNLQFASDHLQYAWSLQPELPQAPTEMIPIAMTSGPSDEDAYFWFLRALEGQFDEPETYKSFSYALTTRWGGSRQWLYDLAADCIDTGRFDTYVPYAAIYILLQVQRMELDDGEELRDDERATRLAQQFLLARDRFRKTHPDVLLYDADGSLRADIALLLETCGTPVESAAFLEEVGEDIDWSFLQWKNRPGRYLAARTLAAQEEIADRVLAFDDALRAPISIAESTEDLDRLEASLRELRESVAAIPASSARRADFFRHAEAILQQRRTFRSGEWVVLPLAVPLWGSELYANKATMTSDGALELSARNGKMRQLCLRPMAGFQPPLEVEAEFEILDATQFPPRFGIGWSREGLTSYADRGAGLPLLAIEANENKDWKTKEMKRSDMACISFWDGHQTPNVFLANGPRHRLHARLWRDACEYLVGGQWLMAPLPQPMADEGWLCLGASWPEHRSERNGAFRLRNVRWRRLMSAPPPAETAPLEERASYWEERLAADSDDVVAIARLTDIRFDQGRDDEVLTLAARGRQLAPDVNGVRRPLGAALARRGDYAAALAAWKAAVNEPGDDFELCWRKAEVLAAAPEESLRDGKTALGDAKFACGAYGKPDPEAFAARAAAHAELGNFEEAIKSQEEFLHRAGTENHDGVARLALYRGGKPFRLPAGGTRASTPDAASPSKPNEAK